MLLRDLILLISPSCALFRMKKDTVSYMRNGAEDLKHWMRKEPKLARLKMLKLLSDDHLQSLILKLKA